MAEKAKNCSRLWIVLLGLLVAGCGVVQPGSERLPIHRELASLPEGPLCRVAVLPFLNDSDFPLGGAIVNKVFTAELQTQSDYFLIQPGDVHKIYQQLRLLPGEAPNLEQMQIVADRVNAQLLISGIVLEMREDPGEHRTTNPMIVMELSIRDGTTGETLWTAFHRRHGTDFNKTMHFGTIHTVTGLSRQMAVEIINLWYEKGLKQCNVSPRS